MYASRNPMHAMYIKTSQPKKTSLSHVREKEIRNPAQTACKCIKKRTYSSVRREVSYLFETLMIDESIGHQSTQMKEIYAIVDTPRLCEDLPFSPFTLLSLIKHCRDRMCLLDTSNERHLDAKPLSLSGTEDFRRYQSRW